MQRRKLLGLLLLVGILAIVYVSRDDSSAKVDKVEVEQINTEDNTNYINTYILESKIQIQSKTNNPVYNPNNIREVSNISHDKLYQMLEGKPIQRISNDFIYCEEKYGISALFLVGLISQESGYGTSKRANNGSNNLSGHAVYNNLSRGTYFDSWGHCVEETAKLINDSYLSEDGDYFNGYSIWDINKKYSADKNWSNQINQIINDLM